MHFAGASDRMALFLISSAAGGVPRLTGSRHKGQLSLFSRRLLRQSLRLGALAVVVVLLAAQGQHVGWWRLPNAVSPLVGLASAITLRTATITTLLALPALLMVLVWPRSFCRYVCPTGLLADGAGRLCPWRKRSRHVRLPALGAWALVIALAGACVGYPLLAWMDPLVLLTATVTNLRTLPPTRAAMISAAESAPPGWPAPRRWIISRLSNRSSRARSASSLSSAGKPI